MDNIGSRFKRVRKEKGLTQDEMGKICKVSGSAVARYESGEREIPDTVIELVCTKLGVYELWIRTGEGKGPWIEKSRKAKIAEVLGKAAVGNTVKDKMIRAFASLPDEAYKALADWAEAYAAEVNAAEAEEPKDT